MMRDDATKDGSKDLYNVSNPDRLFGQVESRQH
jgi:hypothetical protein